MDQCVGSPTVTPFPLPARGIAHSPFLLLTLLLQPHDFPRALLLEFSDFLKIRLYLRLIDQAAEKHFLLGDLRFELVIDRRQFRALIVIQLDPMGKRPANTNTDQNPDNPFDGQIPGGASVTALAALDLTGVDAMDTTNWATNERLIAPSSN